MHVAASAPGNHGCFPSRRTGSREPQNQEDTKMKAIRIVLCAAVLACFVNISLKADIQYIEQARSVSAENHSASSVSVRRTPFLSRGSSASFLLATGGRWRAERGRVMGLGEWGHPRRGSAGTGKRGREIWGRNNSFHCGGVSSSIRLAGWVLMRSRTSRRYTNGSMPHSLQLAIRL